MDELLDYMYRNRKYASEYVKGKQYNAIEDMRIVDGPMVVDIHTHIMPNIDDGSRGIYESIRLLNQAVDKGITDIFLTPHSYFIHDDVYKRFDDFKKEIEKYPIPIRLYLGCELLSMPETLRETIDNLRSGKYPTMNGTEYVLVEPYPYKIDVVSVREMMKAYKDAGYKPILAHQERYNDDVQRVRGILKQSNASEYQGKGKVHFIGSDAHQMGWREPDVIKQQGKFNKNCIKYLNIKEG